MDIWNILEYAAWAASATFGLLIIRDWVKIYTTWSEEVLTSSREGELEAMTEKHKL
jgi:hypothetical protein